MKLIIQPDDGLVPVVKAVREAKKSVDIVIFRFDRVDLEKALTTAVSRGVRVRACIAHTNRGGEKKLRKLEMRLLDGGVTVARTADDLQRYHGKMLLADDTLHVYAFNFTKLDVEKSRSLGVITRDPKLVQAACALFEADAARQPYTPGSDRFVVSPENSRQALMALIKTAKRELLIYDDKITDRLIVRLLLDRLKAGVAIRVIGKLDPRVVAAGAEVRKLTDLRLHLRAIVVDGARLFVGSQSLRKLQLEGRREIGVIVNDARMARKVRAVFEADWENSGGPKDTKETKDAKRDATPAASVAG